MSIFGEISYSYFDLIKTPLNMNDNTHVSSPNNGWEGNSWCVVACEAGLAHTGAVVDDHGQTVVIVHDCRARHDKSTSSKSVCS